MGLDARIPLAFDVDIANAMLSGLVAANVEILRRRPELAAQLRHVRYRRERRGRNVWLTIDRLVAAGAGDCEDLAAAWAAVALLAGASDAAAVAYEIPDPPDGGRLMHIITRAWGRLWDPSKAALAWEAFDILGGT